MNTFSITSSPDAVINAFRDGEGKITLSIENVASLIVNVTADGVTFLKSYSSELIDGVFDIDISRYIQGFTVANENIYVDNCQVKSFTTGLVIDYAVSMTATFEDTTTSVLSLTGKAIAGI